MISHIRYSSIIIIQLTLKNFKKIQKPFHKALKIVFHNCIFPNTYKLNNIVDTTNFNSISNILKYNKYNNSHYIHNILHKQLSVRKKIFLLPKKGNRNLNLMFHLLKNYNSMISKIFFN